MPIYEYVCDDCQTHFEKIVFNKTQEIACPSCAGNTLARTSRTVSDAEICDAPQRSFREHW